ncbi:unnamed protein product [Prunus armeniaca]
MLLSGRPRNGYIYINSQTVADLCKRKEVRLHLWLPEISITDAGVAPLLQTSNAHNVFDEMRKPLGWGAAGAASSARGFLFYLTKPGQNDVVLDHAF